MRFLFQDKILNRLLQRSMVGVADSGVRFRLLSVPHRVKYYYFWNSGVSYTLIHTRATTVLI